jgi:hypothetical protein
MTRPNFLRHISPGFSRRYELVHVESGAVLGSRVEIGADERPWRRRPARVQPGGEEPALLVAGSRWAHTCRAPGPADIVFVDAGGTVLKALRNVRPWRVVSALGADAVIAGPPGFIERTDTSPGVRLALREAQAARPLRDVSPARSAIDLVPESIRAAVRSTLPDALLETDDGFDPWHMGADESLAAARPPAPPPPPVRAPSQQAAGAETPSRQQGANLPAARQTPPPAIPIHVPAGAAPRQPPALPLPRHTPGGTASRPTPAGPVARNTPVRQAFATGVGLLRLIARQTPLAWFEAVAIAQELYVVLLARGPADLSSSLEAGDVAITPDGGIELRRDQPPGLPPVPQAARILLTLLGEAQTLPVQLRLLALQEVSPSPSCQTLLELSTRLANFERPGRQAIIREVYRRFSQLPVRDAETRAAVSPPAALTAPPAVPWWQGRRARALAGVGAAAMVLFLAAVWLWSSVSPPPAGRTDQRGPAAKAVGGAVGSVASSAVDGAGTLARWVGLAPSAEPTSERPAEAPGTSVAGDTVLPARPRARAPRAVSPAGRPEPASAAETPRVDATIYSAADRDVTPPALDRSRLPAVPRQEMPQGDLPVVEVVVSTTGEVEAVKLVTQPTGVLPAMMLSAIKAWRFAPATRDGRPVRYRLAVRLTAQ